MESSSPDKERRLDVATIRQGMRYSTLDGIFAVQYITLTTATLLIGFLLALGASAFQIGLVAMFPFLGGLLQPLGAAVVRRRRGWRKPIVLRAALTDDLLWLVTLVAVALLPLAQALIIIIGVLALQQVANAFNAVAWTSWMSDLIPASLRGRYFGRRNFICNGLGAITAVLAGQFVEHVGGNAVWSFAVIIAVGVVARLVSIRFISRQPEPLPEPRTSTGFRGQLAAPFAHRPFRRYLHFGMAWGLAVQLAAPFFAVYMIRDLQIDFGIVTLLAGTATVANLLGQRFWGPRCDRYGNQQVMRLTALIITLQPFWWLLVASTGFGLALIVLLNVTGGFAWAGYLLANGNLMMGLAPAVDRTSFFAMQGALSGLFSAVGALAGGLFADHVVDHLQLVAWLPTGLPMLFLFSFLLRLGAWGLLHRVEEPVAKPRLQAIYLLRDAARTFNIAQGFNPLLHPLIPHLDDKDLDLTHAIEELVDLDGSVRPDGRVNS